MVLDVLATCLKRARLSQIAEGRTIYSYAVGMSLSVLRDGAAGWNCSTVNMQGGFAVLGGVEGGDSMSMSEDMAEELADGCLDLQLANQLTVVDLTGMV